MDDIIIGLVDFILDLLSLKDMDREERGQEIAKKLLWSFLFLFLAVIFGIIWFLEG